MSDSLEMLGNYGCYVDTGSTISFQLGTNPAAGLKDPGFVNSKYCSSCRLQLAINWRVQRMFTWSE